jgi:hypothetical protein
VLAAIGGNVHALVAALSVRRLAPASTLQRLARRCGISVLLIVVLALSLFPVALREGFAATEPDQKATRLARALSEAFNCGAVAVLGCVLPAAVALWFWWRARRVAHD